MKFVGFRCSSIRFDGYDVFEDALFKGKFKGAYLIDAFSFEHAKKVFYKELYGDDKAEIKELASLELRDIRESFSEEDLCKEYGEKDGKIMFDILMTSFDRYGEIETGPLDYYYREITRLSWDTVEVLSYQQAYPDMLLFGIGKEIDATNII